MSSTLHLFPYSCQKGVDSSILLCLQNVMSENLQQLLAGVQSCTKLLSVETNRPLDSIIEYAWGYYVIKEYLLFILEYINVEELLQVQKRVYPYCGKLSREKSFANFAVLWLFAEVLSVKFGGVASFGAAKVSNLQKFSPWKSYFHQFVKVFSLERFPLYGIVWKAFYLIAACNWTLPARQILYYNFLLISLWYQAKVLNSI